LGEIGLGEIGLGRAPEPPEAARHVFGLALPMAQAYAELLAGVGVERGLIGPGEAARIWPRHLLNCAVVAELVPTVCTLADLGSGAGLPGLVLAMMRPQARVILLEPMARRITFLLECVSELGLSNVEVRRGRAEEYAGRIEADVVTARAVAGLGRLAVLATGLARPGGLVLAMKGQAAEREFSEARPVLDRLGVTEAEVVEVGGGAADLDGGTATVVCFRTATATAAGTGAATAAGTGTGAATGAATGTGATAGASASPGARRRRGGRRVSR
jgi:16S rRNA (guanine527-N7)-methyltransferase